MHDFAELDDPERQPLAEYHDSIKVDIAAFMLKRMVGDVSTTEERAEFMDACIAAAATLAAGQSVFLAAQSDNVDTRNIILKAGLVNAQETHVKAYGLYLTEALSNEPD